MTTGEKADRKRMAELLADTIDTLVDTLGYEVAAEMVAAKSDDLLAEMGRYFHSPAFEGMEDYYCE